MDPGGEHLALTPGKVVAFRRNARTNEALVAVGIEVHFSIGLEEELLLVDSERHCLKADSDRILATLGDRGVKAENFEAVIELISPPCRTVGEAVEALSELRSRSPDRRVGDRLRHLASASTAIIRSYPRSEVPREFSCWEEFCETADDLAAGGTGRGLHRAHRRDRRPDPVAGEARADRGRLRAAAARGAGGARLRREPLRPARPAPQPSRRASSRARGWSKRWPRSRGTPGISTSH
jgi:hypothetical protein